MEEMEDKDIDGKANGYESSWVRYVKQRIKNNKNFLAIISGPTGSGKSWCALSIAEQMDDSFGIDRVIFKGKDLMRLINYGELKSGSVIIWDETQIDLSNRNWQSITNKLLNFLISTFRHKNFILIFTSPYVDFLDTSTLKMFHANFETMGINRGNGTVMLKPKLLQYNQAMKKWYRKYLRGVRPGIGMSKIRRWKVGKPSQGLIDAYEEKKKMFTAQLNRDIETKLEGLDSMGEVRRPLTDIQEKVIECWRRGITIQKNIAKEIGRPANQISSVISSLFKKGYKKEAYAPQIELKPTNSANSNLNSSVDGLSIDKNKEESPDADES